MADRVDTTPPTDPGNQRAPWMLSQEEARQVARERFKERLEAGEEIGNCACSDEDAAPEALPQNADARTVIGVRFPDSGRLYFFSVEPGVKLSTGDWVICPSSRGREAARVVVSPKQMLASKLEGSLRPIERPMTDADVEQMERHRKDAARLVRFAGEVSRADELGIKAISAEWALDGSRVRLFYSANDHTYVRDLQSVVEEEFGVNVDMADVGPRDEARLIGGLGKCGRTLCCSSWLPMYPDVSMGMAKNQDLSLNPSKVSGLCGRLLCCLSYENEQYRQAKRLLPRLGQSITTPDGEGMVVSLQVLKELVTVRFQDRSVTYSAADLLNPPQPRQSQPAILAEPSPTPPPVESPSPSPPVEAPDASVASESASQEPQGDSPRRRRRRRGRRGGAASDQSSSS